MALQSCLESYLGLPDATLIDVRPEHPKNGVLLMLVTLSGIVTDAKLMHEPKTKAPMLVTLLGMDISVKPVHSPKT